MPQVRKLAPEEVQVIQHKAKGVRTLAAEEYDAILSDYAVGEYGEAILEEDERRVTVQHRLRAAIGRRNLAIEFKRSSGDLVRFLIVEAGDSTPEPEEPPPIISSETPGKRKAGRPKKSS